MDLKINFRKYVTVISSFLAVNPSELESGWVTSLLWHLVQSLRSQTSNTMVESSNIQPSYGKFPVCLSVQAITFEPLDIETSFLVCWYILTISEGEGHIKVKIKYLHLFKFYVTCTPWKWVVCIRLKCYLFRQVCHHFSQTEGRLSNWRVPYSCIVGLHLHM